MQTPDDTHKSTQNCKLENGLLGGTHPLLGDREIGLHRERLKIKSRGFKCGVIYC